MIDMSGGRIVKIKQCFEGIAKVFDVNSIKVLPFYNSMLQSLVFALPFKREDRVNILDLGCGTGNVAKSLLERFVNSSIMCVDLSENMLGLAKAKLKHYKNVRYWLGDMHEFDYAGQYDAIVSSLVLHHFEDRDKEQLYGKIFNSLVAGGIFCNADFIPGSNKHLHKIYKDHWEQFLGKKWPSSEINKIMARYQEEDRPANLIDEMRLLEKVGFSNIDIIWRRYSFAVYSGQKPFK